MMKLRHAEIGSEGGSSAYIQVGEAVLMDRFGSVEQLQEVRALARARLLPFGVTLTDDEDLSIAQVIYQLPVASVEEAQQLAKEKAEEFDRIVGEFQRYRKFQMATNNFILQKKGEE